MIIGEAPGPMEDQTGRLLQGKASKLLKGLLEAAGITDYYFTYAAKCRPPENRSPSASEIKTCKPYLESEIASVKPKFIMTLGAVAFKALTKRAGITELHGQVIDYNGIPLMPTFHPAMALRDPGKIDPLRKDITRLGHLIKGNAPSTEEIPWKVIRNMDQWNQFIEEYDQSPEAALDVETTGLDRHMEGAAINSLQVGLANGHNWSIPLSVRDSPWNRKLQQQFIDTLVGLSHGKIIVGQNFKFDNLWIEEIYGKKFYLSFDTMLAHHILDENSPHGLKEMATEFCNAPSYDVDLQTKLGKGNLGDFYKYGCFDVYYTLQLYYLYRAKLLKDPSLRRLFYKLVMPAARLFEDVEKEGLFVNLKKLEETEVLLTAQKDALLAKMNKAAASAEKHPKTGIEINWNSPAQIGKLFYGRLNLPILEKTAKGAPSTSESALLQLTSKHPLAKMLMEYRGIEKNLSTYIIGWRKLMQSDRLYMSTKLHGTVTGRFASRLHQVPRDPVIRSIIDAPPGWSFVVADFSQVELRMAAHLSGDPQMKMAFQTKQDIHSLTSSFLLSKAPELLTEEERKMAKAVNFGLLYGMGWPKLVIYARDNYGVDMTDQQAKAFRTRYFETYNHLPTWHARQRRVVKALEQVVSISGRVRRLPGVNSSEQGIRAEAERLAINSPVQGFASGDLKAMAMVEIHRTFSRDQLRIVGEVHDSILFWVRQGLEKQILPKVKHIMEHPSLFKDFKINFTVPLVADIEIGPWGRGEPFMV